jgi:hypothetical protein
MRLSLSPHTRFETNGTDRLGIMLDHRKQDDQPDHAHGGRMINPVIRLPYSITCFPKGVCVAEKQLDHPNVSVSGVVFLR